MSAPASSERRHPRRRFSCPFADSAYGSPVLALARRSLALAGPTRWVVVVSVECAVGQGADHCSGRLTVVQVSHCSLALATSAVQAQSVSDGPGPPDNQDRSFR